MCQSIALSGPFLPWFTWQLRLPSSLLHTSWKPVVGPWQSCAPWAREIQIALHGLHSPISSRATIVGYTLIWPSNIVPTRSPSPVCSTSPNRSILLREVPPEDLSPTMLHLGHPRPLYVFLYTSRIIPHQRKPSPSRSHPLPFLSWFC